MNEKKTIEYRSEILFLYDVTNANPNGDPYENKPRQDPASERNIVSDTRLKRTIRDYLLNRKQKIFVRIEYDDKGSRKTREELGDEIWKEAGGDRELATQKFNETFIDLRLFGATVAAGKVPNKGKQKQISNDSEKTDVGETSDTTSQPVHWIGPVQFKFGQSLHPVEIMNLRGTSVLPSKKGNTMGTFTDFWYVPYSLIAFYGIVNEEQAINTGLTDDDLDILMDAIWNGTKGLTSRSKFGQVPRLLMQVSYRPHFHIGALDSYISLQYPTKEQLTDPVTRGKNIRSIEEIQIDISKLIAIMKKNAENIVKIRIRFDSSTHFVVDGNEWPNLLESLANIQEFKGKVEKLEDRNWTAE
ncbi:MAG: type I-B CRISPR-associated protein Cas7/Csh2 [Candidatus Micrarchaeaceae archaeon]